MLLIFFSLLSFCYRAYWPVNPWGTCFTWSHPRRVAFQFNQEPSWLLRYRQLAFSRFVSLWQITHESKTSSALKDSDIIQKYWSKPRLSFLYSINLELQSENTDHHKPSTNPWNGEFLHRITSYRMPQTICNTTWMNLCPNHESARDSLKNRNLKKRISYSTKTRYSKKILNQHHFKIFLNLISNPLWVVFVKFHNMKQKKNSNVAFKL